MEDVPEMMKMDIDHGLIYVQGLPHKMEVGMNIGSPIAAGGASAVVGVREHKHDQRLPSGLRRHLAYNVYRRRWMDDVVLFIRKAAPQ